MTYPAIFRQRQMTRLPRDPLNFTVTDKAQMNTRFSLNSIIHCDSGNIAGAFHNCGGGDCIQCERRSHRHCVGRRYER